MQTVHQRCAGLDVHKKTVVACRIILDSEDQQQVQTRTFSTMTGELLALLDWLEAGGCTIVAMESTGEYWKPIYNILEGHFELVLANAQHLKAVPGRKTDVKDARWIAELLQHGLLKASFVPPSEQRDLRDLTRLRSNFIRERATQVNRVHKLLEGANIKLASVATDVMGKSGRAMLDALLRGEVDPVALSALAKGRLKEKREALEKALEGRVRPVHRILLNELLSLIDSLDDSIARLDAEIEKACCPFAEAVAHLDTIPGVARPTAELILSEVGADMTRFPTAAHLCAWAGVAPGNNESAGKRLSGRTRRGNKALKVSLVQAAQAAARTKDTYLSAQFRRLAARRGHKRAVMAVAHSILVIAYHILERKQPYQELGGNYFDAVRPEIASKRLVDRLTRLGYKVTLEQLPAAA